MNGLVKVPMQFLILLLGALLFTFYQFNPSPVFFNKAVEEKAMQTSYKDELAGIKQRFDAYQIQQQEWSRLYTVENRETYKDSIANGAKKLAAIQKEYKTVLAKASPGADTNDTNYIFLRFVVDFLPKGLVGLLIAIIFLAAWGSIAAALNSLASCTMIDFHQRLRGIQTDNANAEQCALEYKQSKYYTLAWGIFCIITAEFASGMGSLIEAVNVLGSLFYGVILGIFLVAFYMKQVKANAVFAAAIIGELVVIAFFLLDRYNVIGLGFLWLNVVGAVAVILLSGVFQLFQRRVA
jgi:hypothetical protein